MGFIGDFYFSQLDVRFCQVLKVVYIINDRNITSQTKDLSIIDSFYNNYKMAKQRHMLLLYPFFIYSGISYGFSFGNYTLLLSFDDIPFVFCGYWITFALSSYFYGMTAIDVNILHKATYLTN